ncbi:hypothetical protein HMPREF1314_1440, partial [Bifidobacterium longum subsp. longum 35B]
MVKANSELVTSIIGALLSWRTCTVDQLRAGLSVKGAPEFHRDEPNLYGALCRLGVIDIGFSPYERFSGQIIPQTWLSLSSDKKLIRNTLGLFNSATWLRRMLSDKQLIGMRRHVRHNTYAAHVGLHLGVNPDIKLVGGDGWGSVPAHRPAGGQRSRTASQLFDGHHRTRIEQRACGNRS